MKAAIIIAAVVVFLIVLLLLPFRVNLSFNESFKFKLYYFGIKIFDNKKGKKEKKQKEATESKKEPESKKEKKENFLKEDFKRLGAKDFIKFYGEKLREVLEKLIWFIKKLKIKILLFDLTVATDNAFDTAIEYGTVCAAVYPVLSVICSNADIKLKKINISTDFNKTSYDFSAETDISVSLIFIIVAAISFLKIYNSLNKEKRTEGER